MMLTTRIDRMLCLVISLLAPFGFSSCKKGPGTKVAPKGIQFVLPVDFHGPFMVIEDKDAGKPAVDGDTVVMTVRESRIVRIISFQDLPPRFELTAKYVDGRPLVYEEGGAPVQPNDIALRSPGWRTRDGLYAWELFVGKANECSGEDFERVRSQIHKK